MSGTEKEPLIQAASSIEEGLSQPSISAPSQTPRTKTTWIKRSVRKLRTKLPRVSEATYAELAHAAVEFVRDPVNLALLVWMLLSAPDCIFIVLLKLGYLQDVIPDREEREKLDEVATQFVNALFFLTCLIVFPLMCRHTFLLWRWSAKDKVELREAYAKHGKRKPHDWTHMAIVVFWGQVTCWTTFGFAAIYWLWPYGSTRPATLLSWTFALSMLAPVLSFLHLLLSPLSQEYDIVKAKDEAVYRMFQRTNTFFQSHREVDEAEWKGRVIPDCCADKKVATLTCLFPCCMFGYNQERLGFGHRAVHTLVFLIVLFGPVTVFMICAASLRTMGFNGKMAYRAGIVLTLLGPAYGGAWRIRMRETYKLPGQKCCSSRRLTDVCLWIFCCYCALCQEIRTTDAYDIDHGSFYSLSREEGGHTAPVEDGEESEEEVEEDEETGGDSKASIEAPQEQGGFAR